MASLICRPDGSKEVQFIDPIVPDARRKLCVGRMNKTQGNGIREKIEKLISAKKSGTAIESSVAEWVATTDAKIAAKLAEWKLIEPRADLVTDAVIKFVDGYMAKRTDVKPRTKTNHKQARGFLLTYFGTDRRLNEVTKLDAKQFRAWMIEQGHSENYIRTQCKNIRMFFNAAVDGEKISANPFQVVPCRVVPVPDKQRFIEAADIKLVLPKLPNTEWRALVCLARWGGLRIPSEIQDLKLTDIDWEAERITIMCPKLERFEGKDRRVIPLFPELLEPLRDVAENAADGEVYLLPSLRGDRNLRTAFNRYVERAGLTPWIRPFQNMRSTRETELTETFPLKTVAEWMGHDPKVSLAHYQQVLDEHWDRAVSAATPERIQGAKSGAVREHLEPVGVSTATA